MHHRDVTDLEDQDPDYAQRNPQQDVPAHHRITPIPRATPESRQSPASRRLHEIIVFGHCRRTNGSTAIYNIHIVPERNRAVLIAMIVSPNVWLIEGKWLRQRNSA